MGFNRDQEQPANLSDFLMSRSIPDHTEVDISKKDYEKLTGDNQANLSALISIIEEYNQSFYKEDMVADELGPDMETDTNIPVHLRVWFDRHNLEKLVDGASKLVCDEFTDENLHCATALISAYYTDAKSGWETDLGMVVDMEGDIARLRELIKELRKGIRKPETLQEISALEDLIKNRQGSSEAAQKKVAEKKAKIKTALQAQAYITDLYFD